MSAYLHMQTKLFKQGRNLIATASLAPVSLNGGPLAEVAQDQLRLIPVQSVHDHKLDNDLWQKFETYINVTCIYRLYLAPIIKCRTRLFEDMLLKKKYWYI